MTTGRADGIDGDLEQVAIHRGGVALPVEGLAERHLLEHPAVSIGSLCASSPYLYLVHRIADEDEAVVHHLLTATARIVGVSDGS